MNNPTIYAQATVLMQNIIQELLELAEKTERFTAPKADIWKDDAASRILLTGKNIRPDQIPKESNIRANLWLSRAAVAFNLELAAVVPLYLELQKFTDELIREAYSQTDCFQKIADDWIVKNPRFLPVVMHVCGVFSKQGLLKEVGSANDNKISRKAGAKITSLLRAAANGKLPDVSQVKERIKATTEGIVRDVVGRLLLEEFVDHALKSAGVAFKRESEYNSLSGVVYDFRADFVVPDEVNPKAFVEVRKSSSRHASLYAKDKMFSAINWKGKHQHCLGIVVVDGEWTQESLQTMARVFDYVVPIAQAHEIAQKIKDYVNGDKTVLNWLIQFSITRAT
jgi:hypothetical protein